MERGGSKKFTNDARIAIVNLIIKAIAYNKKKEGNAVLAPGKILQERYQLQQRLGRTAAGHQTWLAVDLESQAHIPQIFRQI